MDEEVMKMEQFEPMIVIPWICEIVRDSQRETRLVYIAQNSAISMKLLGCDCEEDRVYFHGSQTMVTWKPVYYCSLQEDEEGLRIYLNYNIYIHIKYMTLLFFKRGIQQKIPFEYDVHENFMKKTVCEDLYFDVQYENYTSKYQIETKLATKEQYWNLMMRAFQKSVTFSYVMDNIKLKAEGMKLEHQHNMKYPYLLRNQDFTIPMNCDCLERFYMNRFINFGMVHFVYEQATKKFEIVLGEKIFVDLDEISQEDVSEFIAMSVMEDAMGEDEKGHLKVSGDCISYS